MLTHLIILLDDTSVSFCHYDNKKEPKLIGLDDLRNGIVWAMKQNLNVQFVYPEYELPSEYIEAIDAIDHSNIKPEKTANNADNLVLTNWKNKISEEANGSICIVRASRKELKDYSDNMKLLIGKAARVIVILTDVEMFTDLDIPAYQELMDEYANILFDAFHDEKFTQLSLLTDRIMLNRMNNCGAGDNNITLAPNGKFYLCPAFYYDDPQNDVGNVKQGLCIKNAQLLNLDHAPICRQCDAYHCKRCIWMNSMLTLDANTPSHQQCVISHLERNASRKFQLRLNENGLNINPSYQIKEINYIDPFNELNKWK